MKTNPCTRLILEIFTRKQQQLRALHVRVRARLSRAIGPKRADLTELDWLPRRAPRERHPVALPGYFTRTLLFPDCDRSPRA